MKFNWSTGIIIAFVLFMTFILTCIWITTREKIELVSENYYEDELQYQDVIDGKNNAGKLENKLSIVEKGDSVYFTFPTAVTEGLIHFYKVNNSKEDVKLPVSHLISRKIAYNVAQMGKGNYKILVRWENKKEKYFQEQFLQLQ